MRRAGVEKSWLGAKTRWSAQEPNTVRIYFSYPQRCMGWTTYLWHPLQVMPTRLEERIRELCAKAVAAKDSEHLSPILSELRDALHEQDQLAKVLIAERTRMLNPNVNR